MLRYVIQIVLDRHKQVESYRINAFVMLLVLMYLPGDYLFVMQ